MNYILQLFVKIPLLALYGIGVLSIIAGDYFAKLWSESSTEYNAAISIIFYIIGGFVFISIVEKSHSVGISNVVWNIAGIMGTLVLSFFIFSEPISFLQGLGIFFGIISIILIIY